ncbi:MAG: nitrous oxide-stimulated promoter family protein [Spirochaetia bacterium]|nr:nitrous oxide-stimulated promoter family protein [Spirochaetia bacterium]
MGSLRIEREKKTVGFMIRKYCALYHGPKLCEDCENLLRYATERLDNCPYGDKKPFCSACTVHCYEAEKRERIREVMRKIGPRMLYLMPLENARHFWSSIKNRGAEKQ